MSLAVGFALAGALLAAVGCGDDPARPGGPGSGDSTATGALFPLRTEPGKRYLVDAAGRPFLIQGDAAWRLMHALTKPEVDRYLEDRQRRGFNTVMVKLIDHEHSPDGRNVLGDTPFTVPGDFSTPNEAYFAHVDYVLRTAADLGILVLLAPAYMGFDGGPQGWYAEMTQNGAAKLREYGRYVATRLRAHDNILWVNGGDFDPPEKELLRAVATGIHDVDGKWPHTFHGGRGSSALGFLGTSEGWLGVNDIYTSMNDVVEKAFTEYNRSTMPFFHIESFYENERGATALTVRQQAYQALLSGAAGHVMGNNPIWMFGAGWQAALNSPGAQSMTQLRALFAPLPWFLLEPDRTNVVLTAGVETGALRAVAARTADGGLALVYTPSARVLTVDMRRLAGPRVRARWFDPTSGAFTVVAGSPFPVSGPQSFTAPSANRAGDSDWALVLESSP